MAYENTEAAIAAGQLLGKSFIIEGTDVPAVMVPRDGNLKTLENLQELDKPRHIKATRQLRNVDDFIEYHNRFSNDESTILVEVDKANFISILDHHSPTEAQHGYHKAEYRCPETDEWQNWKEMDKKGMSQEEFASFLESNHLQVIKPVSGQFTPEELDVVQDKLPTGTDMLEIAKTLQITESSNITAATNLHNGAVKIDYQEEINGNAGANGSMEIPTYFVIAPQLFKDGQRYLILCRFKYRKRGPKLALYYELVRPHKSHEAAVKDVINAIRFGRTEGEGEATTEYPGMARGHLYEVV